MINVRAALAAVLLMAIPSVGNAAVLFQGSFAVNAQSSDPGLVISTAQSASPFSLGGNQFQFTLSSVGDTESFNLFRIWTNETSINSDDTVAKTISTVFNFVLPPPAFGGQIDGDTDGVSLLLGLIQYGTLEWDGDGSTVLSFGELGDGKLKIWLEDEVFNKGVFGLNEGEHYGAEVKVKFKLLAEATEVPEPVTISLLGAGLAGLGFAARRRRHS